MSGLTIEDGSKVILKKESFLRSVDVRRGKKVALQKLRFVLDNAIGYPYGSIFEVKDGQLSVKQSCDSSNDSQLKPSTTSGENNQLIKDDGSSQKMSRDDIMALKADGVAGEKIVDQLVENSDSFDKKTEFSQEKYLKKKKKRHIAEVTFLKPTLPLICEMLYVNSPGKILDLRMDTVSQILTMANIQSNTNVMLMESTQSFLAGAILHRMGGLGNLVQIYNGDFPVRLCLDCFDFEKKDTEILNGFPMTKINDLLSPGLAPEDSGKPSTELSGQSDKTLSVLHREEIALSEEAMDESTPRESDNNKLGEANIENYYKALTDKQKVSRKKNRDDEEEKALQVLKKRSMDSLIIATKFHAKTSLLKLIEFLAPSRPIVVYSPHKEILVECYTALKKLKNVVLLNLTETWWRSYQVLPSRTHPQIMMDGSGGYLLTGMMVDNRPLDCDDIVKPTNQSPVKKTKME